MNWHRFSSAGLFTLFSHFLYLEIEVSDNKNLFRHLERNRPILLTCVDAPIMQKLKCGMLSK